LAEEPQTPGAEKPREAAKPAKREAADASGHPWVRSIRAAVPDAVVSAKEFAGEVTVVVARDAVARVARHLKDAEDFRYCVDVTAVDWKTRAPRFDVVYHLYSITHNHRLRLRVPVEQDDASVPTATALWPIANWLEREVWDMFGIRFTGHPDLRRLLMYEEFVGHPLRKDYPLRGRQPLVPEREVHDIFRGPGPATRD
jgi:NADH-quinone oxidoreductase subunit C